MFSNNEYVCFMSFRCINMIYDLDIFIDMLLHDRFVKQFKISAFALRLLVLSDYSGDDCIRPGRYISCTWAGLGGMSLTPRS